MKKILCSLFVLFSVFSIAVAQDDEFTRIMKEGIKLHDSGNYQEAVEKYKEALKLSPQSGLANYEIALSYHAMQDFPNAIKYADAAISKKDDSELSGYIIKGSATDDAGDTKSALKIYEKAIKRFPENYLLRFNYGISCSRVGETKKAEESFIKALQLNPAHPGSNVVLAYLKLDQDNTVKGIMGLYFFLLLENNTERAKLAFERLHTVMYSGVSEDPDKNSTTLSLTSMNNEADMAAELGLKMLVMESEKNNADKNFYERFAADTHSFFSLITELDRENKKKKKKDVLDVWSEIYMPVFYGIFEQKHTEAFVYHIASASQNELVSAWIENNQDKMDAFYKWLEQN